LASHESNFSVNGRKLTGDQISRENGKLWCIVTAILEHSEQK